MARLLPHLPRSHGSAATVPVAPAVPGSPDLDALIAPLRDVWARVPCAGCGGAHEMTCAELLTRQLVSGAGWPSEECDDGGTLNALLSPEEATDLRGDVNAVRALLAGRSILIDAPSTIHAPDPHRILLSL